MKKKTVFIAVAAVTAALYVALTYLSNALGLASGAIQFRLSEALTILPFFTPAAIPGLTIGCILANTLTGCVLADIVFGSAATLLGAIGTYLLSRIPFCKKTKGALLCTLPPVIANVLIVPYVLRYAYGVPDAIPFMMLTVGIGEVVCCCLGGGLLLLGLKRTPLPKELSAAQEPAD
ncbi:MAG: QueT transporter family protein [Lachnospiraceae bacterium]|nr:QueT transporter family protein [Lachnospiraceae bacterium]